MLFVYLFRWLQDFLLSSLNADGFSNDIVLWLVQCDTIFNSPYINTLSVALLQNVFTPLDLRLGT